MTKPKSACFSKTRIFKFNNKTFIYKCVLSMEYSSVVSLQLSWQIEDIYIFLKYYNFYFPYLNIGKKLELKYFMLDSEIFY